MISRRHCAIVRRDDAVVIVDLGARNKTVVNGNALTTGKPVRLTDQDKIQIGKVKFRVFIHQESGSSSSPLSNESQFSSGGSVDSGGESLGMLLQELDEIASKFEIKKKPTEAPAELQAASASVSGGIEVQSSPKPEPPDEDRSDSLSTATIELTPDEYDEDEDDEDEAVGENNEEEPEETGPKRLPAHLRNRGPVDSQEAAANALKNIFNRR